jgi:thioredoxin 1
VTTTRRRRFLALLAAAAMLPLLWPSAGARAAGEAFDRRAFEAAIAAGAPVLVDVYAAWCPICRAQQAVLGEILADPKFAEIKAFEVDFDGQKDVVRAFGARWQSTLILYADGREVARSVGETDRASIAAMLELGL